MTRGYSGRLLGFCLATRHVVAHVAAVGRVVRFVVHVIVNGDLPVWSHGLGRRVLKAVPVHVVVRRIHGLGRLVIQPHISPESLCVIVAHL